MKLTITSCLLALSFAVFAQIPTSGLIGHYPFNNNANDQSGKNNHGIVKNATPTQDRFQNNSSAYYFDGSIPAYIDLPKEIFYNCSAFTVSLWFKTTDHGCMIGYQNAEVSKFTNEYVSVLYVGIDGKLYGKAWNGYRQPIISTVTQFNDGKWHHALFTTDGMDQFVYVDNQFVGSQNGQVNLLSMKFNQIGTGHAKDWPGCDTTWFPFTGSIDDIAIYDRRLSLSDIAKLYNDRVSVNNEQVQLDSQNRIYPVPATNVLNVDLPDYDGIDDLEIQLINSKSGYAYSQPIADIHSQIDVESLPRGFYLLEIRQNSSGNVLQRQRIMLMD